MGTFTGENGVLEQPKERQYSKGAGWSTIRKWIGPTTDILSLAASLATEEKAQALSITGDGPTDTLTATYPDAQDGGGLDLSWSTDNVSWELLGGQLEKDIRTHYSLFTTTEAEMADIIKAEYAARSGGVNMDGSNYAPTTIPGTYVYNFLRQGTTSYQIAQWVLRKTTKIGTGASVKVAVTGINKIESVSGTFNDGVIKLFDLPAGDGWESIEWLKQTPQVRIIGRGKYSITQDWLGGVWSTLLYGGSHSP